MALMKMKEVCTKIGSGATPRGGKKSYTDSGVSLIRSQNVLDFSFSYNGMAHINEGQAEKLNNVIVKKDDVLLNITGDSVARACLVEESVLPARVNQHVAIVRANPEIAISSYLLYFLQIKKPYLLQLAAGGATRNALTKRMIEELEIDIPIIEKQKKIVSIVDDLQKKIKKNNEINENLQQQAQAIYEEMFINNSDVTMTSGTLSDIATVTMGQSPKGSSYNEQAKGEVFYQGRAEFGFRFPSRRLYTTEPKRIAELGDVLLSVRAPVGDLNVAYERCCIGRGLGAIHSKDGHSSFILYTMFSLKPQLDVFNGEGTVFGSINRDSLNAIPVEIPSPDKIEQFEVFARPMDDLIRSNYEEICRLEALRDSLLPKLMSGEIDISGIQL